MRGADRRADLHRRLGDESSPGNPEQAAYLAEQAARGQPRWRAGGSHAASCWRRWRLVPSSRRCRRGCWTSGSTSCQGLADPARGRGRARLACGRQRPRLAAPAALIAGALRLRSSSRATAMSSPTTPHHPGAALRAEFASRETMHIVNTAGWDTDCNAGNIGCPVRHQEWSGRPRCRAGLAHAGGRPDVISSADGGAAVTDAVIETGALVRRGLQAGRRGGRPAAPKGGRASTTPSRKLAGLCLRGGAPATCIRCLWRTWPATAAWRARPLARLPPPRSGRVARVSSPTFFGKDGLTMPTYQMVACQLYPGRTVDCGLAADVPGGSVSVRLYRQRLRGRRHVGEDPGARLVGTSWTSR